VVGITLDNDCETHLVLGDGDAAIPISIVAESRDSTLHLVRGARAEPGAKKTSATAASLDARSGAPSSTGRDGDGNKGRFHLGLGKREAGCSRGRLWDYAKRRHTLDG